MAFPTPPDGIIPAADGTTAWGTNCDREETIYLTGSSSVKLYTASQVVLYGPMVDIGIGPRGLENQYEVALVLRASAVGLAHVTLELEIFGATGALITTGTAVAEAALPSVDTWHVLSYRLSVTDSTWKFMRWKLTKNNQSFSLYLDSAEIRAVAANALLVDTLTTTAATWTNVPGFANSTNPTMAVTSATGVAVLRSTPHYFLARAEFTDTVSDGETVGIRISENGGSGVVSTTLLAMGAAMKPCIHAAYLATAVNTAAEYRVDVYSTNARAVTVYLSAHEIR